MGLTALPLLTEVARKATHDFSGLGIVIYESLSALPFVPLDVAGGEQFKLPVFGFDDVGDALARAASKSTHWHDGFHLVNADPLCLTHICQFISPPLPPAGAANPLARGARHMTALLASKVTGIVAVGILTQERIASIYESGVLTVSRAIP